MVRKKGILMIRELLGNLVDQGMKDNPPSRNHNTMKGIVLT